jgi:hypothetical protein
MGHQVGPLQSGFGPGVAIFKAVAAHQVFMKMLRREIPVPGPVFLKHPSNPVHRRCP